MSFRKNIYGRKELEDCKEMTKNRKMIEFF